MRPVARNTVLAILAVLALLLALGALRQQYPAASEGDGVRVRHDGTTYRLSVTQAR